MVPPNEKLAAALERLKAFRRAIAQAPDEGSRNP